MESRILEYRVNGAVFKGYLTYPEQALREKRPAIIVVHAWRGQDAFAREKAQALADLGYIGFAADLYGEGREAKSDEEAGSLMKPLFLNRPLLRERIVAAYETVRSLDVVDSSFIGAIGFCFGGLTVLELLRSGVDIKAIVSFHGVLTDHLENEKATLAGKASKIKGSALILHGYQDPLVSQEDLIKLQQELAQAQIDWQLYIYGGAKHAFTNPEAHNEQAGLIFNAEAAKRSWSSMQEFLAEKLQ